MASTEAFLLRLAQEEGIPADRVRPFIEKLNQEWYETEESLRKLSVEEMERLSIPHRLARLIVDRLGGRTQSVVEEQKEVNLPVRSVEEIPKKADALAGLVSAGIEDPVDGGLSDCITTLQLVIVNILRHPREEKYARLRLSNPGVQKKIGRFPDAIRFLKATGFTSDSPDTLLLSQPDEACLKDSLTELNTVADNLGFPAMEVEEKPLGFDPYKAQVSSLNPDNPRIAPSANDPALIARRAEEIRREREVTCRQEQAKQSKIDRNPVVLRMSETGNLQAALRQLEVMENERLAAKFGIGYTVSGGRIPQASLQEDEELSAMKALIRENEENSKFHSKRKEELSRLQRQKSYTAVTIRIRFPDRFILQGTFSSLDSTQTVYEFLSEYLETPYRPFCLYVAPPKQVIEGSVKRLLKEFAPAILMNFAWRELRETGPTDGPFLKEEAKGSARNMDS